MTTAGRVRIGISAGPTAWRAYLSEGPAAEARLAFRRRELPRIEINGTFYGSQRPDSFARGRETAEGLRLRGQAPRYSPHPRRVRSRRRWQFPGVRPLRLGPSWDPILWKLPPSFRFEPERSRPSWPSCPHDTEAAAAWRAGTTTASPAGLDQDRSAPAARHASKSGHDSFLEPGLNPAAAAPQGALVCADTVDWPRRMI